LINVTQRVDHGMDLRVRDDRALRQIGWFILSRDPLSVSAVNRINQGRRVHTSLNGLRVLLESSLGVRQPFPSQFVMINTIAVL
jgi:hypothetical protein